MEFETLIYKKENGVGTITLNRPQQRNALNEVVAKELEVLVKEIATDESVRVVILTGGKDFFAAGADIKMVSTLSSSFKAYDFSQLGTFSLLAKLEKPVIAAISGFALGGGLELVLACDIRIASETAVFGQPEINLGIIPGAGGTQRLPRIVGLTKAKEMLFTGDPIDAKEAYRIGLVNKVVPVESLMEEALKLAQKIASKPAMAVKATKMALNTGMNLDLESALKFESQTFGMLFSTHDQKEGVSAFIEKRKPVFKGE
jgi:enoyl-CoA hydratase